MHELEIRRRFDRALHSFYAKEALLIKYHVSERALTHKLAEHLQKLFPRHNVDCEYNKVGDGDPKRLDVLMWGSYDCSHDCDQCRNNKCVIFPDIIVHHRGKDDNLLVIEAKTAWNRRGQAHDFKKLAVLTEARGYHYRLGIAFRFDETYTETQKNIIEYTHGFDVNPSLSVPARACPCLSVPQPRRGEI